MTAWALRPRDEARLFNPAFLAALLGAAAQDYERRAGRPMPWIISFLVLPLALHSPTRQELPKTIAALFPNWIRDHPEMRAGFPARAASLVPATREALRFGLNHRALELFDQRLGAATRIRPLAAATDDVRDCFRQAAFCGRWFTRYDPTTLFALLGVQP